MHSTVVGIVADLFSGRTESPRYEKVTAVFGIGGMAVLVVTVFSLMPAQPGIEVVETCLIIVLTRDFRRILNSCRR